MLRNKQDPVSSLSATTDPSKSAERDINLLNVDTAETVASHVPLRMLAKLARTSKSSSRLFQPMLTEAKEAIPLMTAVVQGDLDEVIARVKLNPAVFFRKCQVTDPAGQTFYDVSPYQLMIFLCDDDMKANIMPLIPERMHAMRYKQYIEIDKGGADLVKIDRDPTLLAFEEVTQWTARDVFGARFPLLENPDGIIFYDNQLYYANQETRIVEHINAVANSDEDQVALDAFIASFTEMEGNSGRRSNNREHQLISRTMQRHLYRKGIQYERDGIHYCDARMEFRLINAYRKCLRLCNEQDLDEADQYWCRGVGGAQREVMWVLQRICEEGRPLERQPWPKWPLKRGFNIFNFETHKEEPIFSGGKFDKNLGLNYAIYKTAWDASPDRKEVVWGWSWPGAEGIMALIILNWFIEDAKTNVIESIPHESPAATLS